MEYQLLTEHIRYPAASVVGQKLATFFYHDVVEKEALTTNQAGIDILAQQVELLFENSKTLFVGWNGVKGWPLYSLTASSNSFCTDSERFQASENYWQLLTGKTLVELTVFGDLKYAQPHLAIFNFEGTRVGIGNCALEFDFIPKDTAGDDTWVLLDAGSIQEFIERLNLKQLLPPLS